MRGGLARLAGSSLDSGEISALPGSYEVSKRANPLYRARNCVTAHAPVSSWSWLFKYFRWNTDMVENLINCLSSYKSSMEYLSLDFDADKPAQYKYLRIEMAKLYAEQDEELFGPVSLTLPSENIEEFNDEEREQLKKQEAHERDLISKGYHRVVEKVKEIRQNFSKAVVQGTRSGCGKFIYEFYDKLITIWGGSANTEPLPYGVSSNSLNNEVGVQSDSDSENPDENLDPTGNTSVIVAPKIKPAENSVVKNLLTTNASTSKKIYQQQKEIKF